MHIFNMSVIYMYLQNAEKIQWKLQEELFHKVNPINHYFLGAVVIKWLS